MYSIDIEELIDCIREHPCIWDKTCIKYRDKVHTATSWEKIFRTLNPEFGNFSEEDKTAFGNEVQRKWNNIRDSFRKYVMQVKNSDGCVVRKYIYYDRLKFLNKIYEFDDVKIKKKPTSKVKSEFDDAGRENWDADGKSRSDFGGYAEKSGCDFADRAADSCESSRDDAEPASSGAHDQGDNSGAYNGSLFGAFEASHGQHRKRRRIDDGPSAWAAPIDDNPHLLFFRGILSNLRDFSDDETINFQMGVLQLIKDTKHSRANSFPVMPS